jgi:hypothetical protein
VSLTDATPGGVADTRPVRVTIEIRNEGGSVTGWLESAGQPRRTFLGMLELLALLEAAPGVRSAAGEGDDRTDLRH